MKTLIFTIILLLLAISSYSQSRIISYEEAIKIATDQNLLIQREENQLDIIRSEKQESVGRYLPSVSARGNADQTSGRQFDLTSGQVVTQTSQRLGVEANVNLLLFDGFNRLNSVKQAQNNFLAQQHNKERIKQQVVFLTTQQYLQILLDKELIKIAEQNVEEQKILRERLKEFSDVGNVPITDFYTQDAEVKRLEMVLIEAENKLLADKALFSATLFFDPATEFELLEPQWADGKPIVENLSIEQLYNLSLQNRRDLKQQDLLAKSGSLAVKIARSRLLPSVSAYYNYGTGYSSVYKIPDPNNSEERVLVPLNTQLFSDNIYSSVGLTMSIPIFNNFRTRALISRNKNLSDNQELITEELKRTIFTEVQAAHLDYKAMTRRYEAAIINTNAAKIAFEAQKERFSVGLGNLLEYNAANTNFIRSQSELVQAQFSVSFQKVILDFFTGTLAMNNE